MKSLITIAFVLLTASCKKPAPDKAPEPPPAPTVSLAPEDFIVAKRGEVQTGPRISGTLEASLRSVVRAETSGAVVAVGPELGQAVTKGELLARVEAKAMGSTTMSARAGVTSAQAQLDLARREVQRMEALVKGGAAPQRDLDRARSQLTAAEAGVAQARAQVASSASVLGDATVRAPITGVIAKRSVNVGDVVSPGAELYTVIDPATMRLDAAVASDDLAAIAPGKTVDFEVRGYPDQKFAGSIARIAPAADPVTRQIQVLVDIPNPGGKLVAGLYAEGRVAVERREALVVPYSAVDSSGDQPTVLRVKDGVVERAVVALGLRDERAEVVEVTTGVTPGDVLLLARATKNVGPGTHVSVPGQAAPATPATPAPKTAAGSGSAAGSSAGSAATETKPVEKP